jgi:hypothetical protein
MFIVWKFYQNCLNRNKDMHSYCFVWSSTLRGADPILQPYCHGYANILRGTDPIYKHTTKLCHVNVLTNGESSATYVSHPHCYTYNLVPNVCSLHSVYAVHAPKQHVIHQKGPNTTKSLFSRCRGLSGMAINKTWVSRFLRPQQVLVQQLLNLSMKARKPGKCFRLFYYILFSFFRKKVKIA